jgi:DNA-binding GntR family transcriptional regulator
LRGELLAGHSIRQEELAAKLGISRIPLREALRQLEAEGFVTSSPHRGVIVAALSFEELREICELRTQLECHLMGLAVGSHDEQSLAAVETALNASLSSDAGEAWTDLNLRFHQALYAPARRPLILGEIARYHAHTERYLRVFETMFEHKEVAENEHVRLLEAVRAADRERAVTILHDHIMAVARILADAMKPTEEPA